MHTPRCTLQVAPQLLRQPFPTVPEIFRCDSSRDDRRHRPHLFLSAVVPAATLIRAQRCARTLVRKSNFHNLQTPNPRCPGRSRRIFRGSFYLGEKQRGAAKIRKNSLRMPPLPLQREFTADTADVSHNSSLSRARLLRMETREVIIPRLLSAARIRPELPRAYIFRAYVCLYARVWREIVELIACRTVSRDTEFTIRCALPDPGVSRTRAPDATCKLHSGEKTGDNGR